MASSGEPERLSVEFGKHAYRGMPYVKRQRHVRLPAPRLMSLSGSEQNDENGRSARGTDRALRLLDRLVGKI